MFNRQQKLRGVPLSVTKTGPVFVTLPRNLMYSWYVPEGPPCASATLGHRPQHYDRIDGCRGFSQSLRKVFRYSCPRNLGCYLPFSLLLIFVVAVCN